MLQCAFRLVSQLATGGRQARQVHAVTGSSQQLNGYNERDFTDGSYCGRLASYNGSTWTTHATTAYYSFAARKNYGRVLYAAGWDSKSAILRILDNGSPDAPTTSSEWV